MRHQRAVDAGQRPDLLAEHLVVGGHLYNEGLCRKQLGALVHATEGALVNAVTNSIARAALTNRRASETTRVHGDVILLARRCLFGKAVPASAIRGLKVLLGRELPLYFVFSDAWVEHIDESSVSKFIIIKLSII